MTILILTQVFGGLSVFCSQIEKDITLVLQKLFGSSIYVCTEFGGIFYPLYHYLNQTVPSNRIFKKNISQLGGWRFSLAIKRTCCFFRGTRFQFSERHPRGISQPPPTGFPGDLTPSSKFCRHQGTHLVCIGTCMQTFIYMVHIGTCIHIHGTYRYMHTSIHIHGTHRYITCKHSYT